MYDTFRSIIIKGGGMYSVWRLIIQNKYISTFFVTLISVDTSHENTTIQLWICIHPVGTFFSDDRNDFRKLFILFYASDYGRCIRVSLYQIIIFFKLIATIFRRTRIKK